MEAIHVDFCTGFNAPTLLRNLQKTSVIYIKHDTPHYTLPIMVHGEAVCNIPPISNQLSCLLPRTFERQ